ncbi:Lipase 4 [Escovopsis weberi]|uniref:Patatin-like phospholipase domain-containing protein n=1 Tax=Escovopsis weberi TaxID=150374 RepID=A0A0M8N0C0_ESCWE|nr:Lipase 4 [Escovopsis weberi]
MDYSPQSLFGTVSKTLKDATVTWRSRQALGNDEQNRTKLKEDKKSLFYSRLKSAGSLEQWQAAAQELDLLEGNDRWKNDPSSEGAYNPALIEERLFALDEARANCDIQAMMHQIRTALSRNLGGMGNVELYKHSHLGTKTLIERYVDSTIQTIDAVIDQSAFDRNVSYKDLLEGMLLARQSFGRSALLLSGGGTFGMAHIGVLKTLFETQLLPRIISGASAGSIVCAIMCTRTDEEIPDVICSFPYGDLAVFDPADKPDSIFDHMRRLFTEGSWSDIKHLSRVMRHMMGDITFQEAYNRTRRILNICVSTEAIYELPRLLNYVTAPNVMIWSAVAASCSVPLVFNGSSLLVKDPATGQHRPWNPTPQRWIDGSVENDLPMTRLAEMFNVNHFIVSQVNPHVAPFLSRDEYLPPDRWGNTIKAAQAGGYDWLQTFTALARDEALHRLNFMAEIGFFPNVMTKFRSVLSQRYSGDINILPEMTMEHLPLILSNPTADFMIRCCLVGQRATWPKLSRVRDSCAVELALDRAVHRLRTRVVFSDSRSELRYLANTPSGNLRPQAQASGLTSFPSAVGLSSTGPAFQRQRRQSGGSLLTLQNNGMMLDDDDDYTNDDAADEDEALEIGSRPRSVPSQSSSGPRKPPLQRATKSSTHVSQYRGSLMPTLHPFPISLQSDLDLSKHSTPPVGAAELESQPEQDSMPETNLTDTDAPFPSDTESDQGTSSRGPFLSPSGAVVESSEQAPLSDTDMGPVSEASEPELFSHARGGHYTPPGSNALKKASRGAYPPFGPSGHAPGHLLSKVQPLARQSQ